MEDWEVQAHPLLTTKLLAEKWGFVKGVAPGVLLLMAPYPMSM